MDNVDEHKRNNAVPVVAVLTIGKCLAELEVQELGKLKKTRDVPSIPDLARAAGVSRGTMYNLVKGNVKHVSLELLAAIINELRRRGFDVELSHLLTTYPAEEVDD
jgi:transcriptional regulator with XRE-family HTH domain